MRKRAPSERKFGGRSRDFQRDMHVIPLPVVYSENRPKAGTNFPPAADPKGKEGRSSSRSLSI